LGEPAFKSGYIGRQLKRLARRRYIPAFHFAAIYVAPGDHESTFTWVRKYLEPPRD
jgi:hypothetical protein